MEQNRKHFPSLTGLKAVMCLIIVFYHTLQPTALMEAIPFTAMIRYVGGNLGNSVFFMLSGFLTVHAYRDRIRSGGIPFGGFVWSKLGKFYGMYLLTNGLSMILRILRYGLSSINLHELSMILLLQNGGLLRGSYPYNGATWFISMLLVCNMLYFALCRLTGNRTGYFCGLAGAILWGYIGMTHEWEFPLVHPLMGVGLVNFFLGCVLAEVYPALSEKTHRRLSVPALLWLGGAAVLMLKNGMDNALGGLYPGIAFGLSPMIVYCALANPPVSRVLSWKPMQALGTVSISIFFWHMVVYEAFLQIVQRLTGEQILSDLLYLGYLLVMMAVSILSYRYLEKRLQPKKPAGSLR